MHVQLKGLQWRFGAGRVFPTLVDSNMGSEPIACGLSGNNKSLLVMFILFSLITGLQYVAAVIAHSVALKADCASMGDRAAISPKALPSGC